MKCSAARASQEHRAKVMKRCAQCEQMFYNRNSAAKYCNQDCYLVAARSRRKGNAPGWTPQQMQCPQCAKFFSQNSVNHQYCTRACYTAMKRHLSYVRLKASSRTDCKGCGTPLTELGRVFCSVSCRTKHYLVGKRLYKKTCPMCRTQFETHNKGRQHCSRTCSNRATARKKQDDASAREDASLRYKELRQTMESRVKHSKLMPLETAYADSIQAFLKRGGTIKQFQPQDAKKPKRRCLETFGRSINTTQNHEAGLLNHW